MKAGPGNTFILKLLVDAPVQLPLTVATETMIMAESPVTAFVLMATKGSMLPVPLAGRPIFILLFVHEKTTAGEVLVNKIPLLTNVPLQKTVSLIRLITGVGFTVTVSESVTIQPVPVDNVK